MKAPALSTILMALTFMIWGCSDGDDSLETTGRLNVFMVDAPFPTDQVNAANVTIFKVEARLVEAENGGGSESMENEDSKGGFITLMEDVVGPVNLLTLIDGASEKLADAEIPAGSYDLIRVYVRDAQVVMNDEEGTTYELKVPSGAQSGIKVFLDPPLQVAGGLSEDLILDFDVSKSFVPKGGSANNPDGITGFNFTPVIRGSNMSFAGSITGTLTVEDEGDGDPAPLEDAIVTLFTNEGAEVTTTFPSESGGYSFPALDPGIYRLDVSLDGYDPQSVDGIEVVVGNNTTQDFTLVPVSETNTEG